MKLKIWRYIFWITFTSAIGMLIQSKAAIITASDIFLGLLMGACVGFFLASIFELRGNRKNIKKMDRNHSIYSGILTMKKTLLTVSVIVVCLALLWLYYEKQTKQVEALIDASMQGDIQKMQELVKGGVNPDGIAYDGLTPIVAATQRHQFASIEYLISVGVDLNKGDENHLTPLFYAALQKDELMYDFLLTKGARFHFPDKLREKYLHDVVEGSKNQQLLEKVNLQLSKEDATKK